jgi:hypothetical protein
MLQSSEYGFLYKIVGRYLAEGYAVIYAAEQDLERVLARMSKAGIDVEHYVNNGTLQVNLRDSIYICDDDGKFLAHQTLEAWRNAVTRLLKGNKVKGVLTIGNADIFIINGQQEQVIELEEGAGKKFHTLTEVLCCYDPDVFSDTSVSSLIAILNAHEYTVHEDATYSEWKDDKLHNVLTSAFNKVLGSTTSELVLKTLKSVYKVDEKVIIANPSVLEDTVGRFFGDSSSAILAAVVKSIKTNIAFRQQSPSVVAS